jgi:hypothetical protein
MYSPSVPVPELVSAPSTTSALPPAPVASRSSVPELPTVPITVWVCPGSTIATVPDEPIVAEPTSTPGSVAEILATPALMAALSVLPGTAPPVQSAAVSQSP